MARITIENEGRITVIENAVDWSIWDSDDVDGLLADYKFNIPESEYPKLYSAIHNRCFKFSGVVEWDDLIDIVISEAEKLGYKRGDLDD